MSCDLSRRDLLKAAAWAGITTASADVFGQDGKQPDPTSRPSDVFCYVDGYHGGIDGHMPASSLPNVLDGLDKSPHWKVSFEIEPYSWAAFAKSDPPSIQRLAKYLSDATPTGRVEIVSGTYAQAYMWNAGGECNIRQFEFGLAELRASFPGIVVDTYAVQEPCWTSCLPQILKSFGYRRVILKNSTCWGGYHAPTFDADLMHWVGPDGSTITAVPRYSIEALVPPATERGAQPTTVYVEQCVDAKIGHPAGTILQDMGWPGHPWRLGMSQEMFDSLRHVTWREYAETIASPPQKQWKALQDDLRVGLPWGGSVLQRIAQVVRAGEHLVLQTEKIAAMAFVRHGKAFPEAELKQPWKDLLWSQHHDVWIVSQNRHGNGTCATAVEARHEAINQACGRVVDDSVAAMVPSPANDAKSRKHLRVFNTTGLPRRDLASFDIAAGEQPRIFDARGRELACQVTSGIGNDTKPTAIFITETPAIGYSTYELASDDAAKANPAESVVKAAKTAAGNVVLETDLYEITIDSAKGGRISSLVARNLKRDFVDASGPRSFNEFRGFFPTEDKWLTSVDAPAEVSILEAGPVRATVQVRGKIGAWNFVTRISVVAGRRRIDFETTFEFPVDVPNAGREKREQENRFRIGEKWEKGRDTVHSNRRPFYDSSFKLQALFPANLRRPTLDKDGPFNVCRCPALETTFNSWDSIKNNVIFNWVDLVEEGGGAGLAVMIDHVTAYSMTSGEPLGIVMCYAGPGIWHDYGLNRVPRIAYSVIPHAGNWAEAQLWRESEFRGEALIARRCSPAEKEDSQWSLLPFSDPGVVVSSVAAEEGNLLVRLFNAEGEDGPKRLRLDQRIHRAWLVELDGRVIEEVPLASGQGAVAATIAMGRFSIRTLRCQLA